MEKRLQEVLRGEEGNYILPFFWQHGESEEKLREMMGAVQDSGIGAVCVESRPHPDFVGPGWWRDMDVIMDEARKRGMRVWVLDDAHFPSGYCNGRVEDKSIYSKRYLDHYTVDAVGPQAGTSFLISLEEGEELIGVVAAKRTGPEAGTLETPVDITEYVRGNAVYWDVPEGYWNVIVVKTTFSGTGRKKYINTVDAAAVRFFLDTVYEPHWNHYKEGMFVLGDEEKEDEVFALRPMTCPFQYYVYKQSQKSYRDLPCRYGETSTLFRNEDSGEMHGLTRVRQFTISEGHLIVRPDQIEEEFRGCVDLAKYCLTTLGLEEDVTYRLSKWDPNNKDKYLGDEETWDYVQNMMRDILHHIGIEFTEEDGEAAFYGPKLENKIGRAHV